MKVLFINTVFGKGSTGKIVKQLGDAIEEAGGEYEVAYGRGELIDASHSYYIGSKLDRYLHVMLSRVTDRAGFYSKNCTKDLIKHIREYKPDIIHLHNLHGYYVNLPILFSFLKEEYQGEIIWTFHDCWPYTGHCTYYTYAGCDEWKTQCKDCPQLKEYPKSILFDSSKENFLRKREMIAGIADKLTVVAVSDWLKNEIASSGIKARSIISIHNGVDTDLFFSRTSNIREKYGIGNKYFFLCVSDGWDKRKGIDKVIELANCIENDVAIVVIGLDKDQIKSMPQNVIGLERTWNQDELIDFYNAADILFNPTNEETFGLVTAEAMACGTPVIVFDTTASPEIVGGEECGLILHDSAQGKDVIKRNYRELFVEKKLKSSNCRSRIEELFSQKHMINDYMKLYKSLNQ